MFLYDHFLSQIGAIEAFSKDHPEFRWTVAEQGKLKFLVCNDTRFCQISNDYVKCEFHVIYDELFEIPVMLLNYWYLEGKLMPLKEIWSTICSTEIARLYSDPYSVLTQMIKYEKKHRILTLENNQYSIKPKAFQEHPLFRTSWYCFHPCKTADFLNPVIERGKRSKNLVAVWLSVMSSVVGISLPLNFEEVIFKNTPAAVEN
ncbi:Ubiquitin-like-conjugating enzyme ATG10 [Trichinella zimbabwensis]|uniref:Ubiquitin-like-conjugating enzyme ATG10 n=1 Tax=Trichinella zimbabwensis TaxID=268475 RepID=A0A0V1HE01_9BILA|nr:Ubiquitin-like-conjugating enzyme ATG10 [Trichinella zimbabwensis]